MNNYFYKAGAVAVAFAMSGLPAVALAEDVNVDGQSVRVQGVSVRGEDVQTGDVRVRDGNVQAGSVQVQREEKAESTSTQEQKGEGLDDSTTTERQGERSLEIKRGRLILNLERDDDRAASLAELKQKIEVRKQELDDEEASSTPETRGIMKNANRVRLAVHALLASKDLVGGIGSQVSEIAKQMNDSVATTTNAEAKIQSRGFVMRLLFGGDSTSADIIAKEAARNQTRIDSLTALLTQTGVSVEMQAALSEQITALKDAQARLKTLAEREQKAWGFFSWRF